LSRSDPAGRKQLEATVHNELCEPLSIEFPLFAFPGRRDVAAAVSNAEAMGDLGAIERVQRADS
jgi:hypothetical protein